MLPCSIVFWGASEFKCPFMPSRGAGAEQLAITTVSQIRTDLPNFILERDLLAVTQRYRSEDASMGPPIWISVKLADRTGEGLACLDRFRQPEHGAKCFLSRRKFAVDHTNPISS